MQSNPQLNAQKIQFFRARIPNFECIPGCHDCCGPVTASSAEMFALPVVSDAQHAAALDGLHCPHLAKNGCTVYAERPLICRVFGTTPRLPCPHGRRPAQMIDGKLDAQIQAFFMSTRQVLL
jgi:uncharacterized protein